MAAVWLAVPLQKCPEWGSWGLYNLHGFSNHRWYQAPLSEISFPPVPLDSLELRALSSAWTLRGFAHTLAHPLGHHTLVVPTFELTLCSDFCSNGMPPPPAQLRFPALVLWRLAHPHCLTRLLALPSCCPVLGLPLIWEITQQVSLQDTQEFLTNILSRPAWGGELIRKDRKKYCVWFFSVWGKTVNDIEKRQKCMKWLPVIQSRGDNHNDWAGKCPFNHLSVSVPIKICVYQLSWMNSRCYSTCVFHSSVCHEHFQGCQWWETCFPFSKNVNYIPQRSLFFLPPPAYLRICFFGCCCC